MAREYVTTLRHPFLKPDTILKRGEKTYSTKYYIEYYDEVTFSFLKYYVHGSNVKDWAKKGYVVKILTKGVPITFNQILRIVTNTTGIPLDATITKTRKKEIVMVRYLIFYYAKGLTDLSLSDIGILIRPHQPLDHATVLHGINTIRKLYGTEPEMRTLVNMLNKIFNF